MVLLVTSEVSAFHVYHVFNLTNNVVIPLRDPRTLKKDGNYLIVFRNAEDLQAWRLHVERLTKLSNEFTSKAVLDPKIPPGPGMLIKNIPVHEVIKKFTLVPVGGRLRSNWSNELSHHKDAIVQRGGYSQICEHNGFINPKVLLRVYGIKLALSDLLQAIVSDSVRRNIAWGIKLKEEGDDVNIVELKSAPYSNPEQSNEDIAFGSGRYGDGQGWILQFETWRAAHQFARTWHGLSFPFPSAPGYTWQLSYDAEVVKKEGSPTKVETEVLW
jgi:hypothetical protein